MEKSLKYFLSLSLIFLFACSEEETSNMTASERVSLSMKVFSEGRHLFQGSQKSMTHIEKAIEIDPNNSDALRELSVAYLKRGLMADWKIRYDKAVIANPDVWIPMRGYLHLLFHRDYDGAIADFNTADSLTPKFKDAPQGQSIDYWRGIAYLGKKDYENSIKNFENHISLETANTGEDWIETTTFLYLGIAYYYKEDYISADKNFDKILRYNRDITADGNYYKAKTLIALGNHKEALPFAKKALEQFKNGSYNKHDYVEVIEQLYESDITELVETLEKQQHIKNTLLGNRRITKQ
ncbi:tetratricopeptide repeat protein [Dokdonia donghaensis]|uniref:tetratricopeptide repeat protein n=1 Tax=Dokdonia donghaensis TaxID=326320 RepID=UPI0007C467AD|nr:tetratricopeptide repeat protein [Dokdonia donghaensis]